MITPPPQNQYFMKSKTEQKKPSGAKSRESFKKAGQLTAVFACLKYLFENNHQELPHLK